MIPNVAKRGTSFKGAGLYHLHDKKQEGETERMTNERVAWTQTRNVMTNDPDFSLRIMAATAMNKDALKEAAGVKKGGRQSKGDVYSYSIAWHPDEAGKIDRAEMEMAADQSIKALGAGEHQALIVCHQDEPHPHVHVIVNLVNPETGKNLPLSNDFKKLEKWAHDYRKGRGEEEIYCVDRTKKMETIEAKKRGEAVSFVRGDKAIPRQLHGAFEAAKQSPANQNDIEVSRKREAGLDAALAQDGKRQQSKHGHQWDALSDNYRLRKAAIWKRYKSENKDARDAIYEQMKPAFAELYRQQGVERSEFYKRERRIGGKLKNVRDAIQYAAAVRGEQNPHITRMVFNFFSKKGRRENWLDAKQRSEVHQLRREQSVMSMDASKQCADIRGNRLKSARQDFSLERLALIGKQKSERQDLRERWKQRTAQKRNALSAIVSRANLESRKEPLVRRAKKNETKETFDDKVTEPPPKPARAKRTRKPRSRKRDSD